MNKEKYLYFNDGHVVNRDTILLASKFRKDEGSDISHLSFVNNLSTIENGEWTYREFYDSAISVTYLKDSREAFFLGRNGYILRRGRGKRAVESLPNREGFGSVLRIRAVGTSVYACGMTGQVYKRSEGNWIHIDNSILGTEGLDFEDIDGTSENNLYAVGMKGVIHFFDGNHWIKVDSPTNSHLSNVRCAENGVTYICGNDGVLFRGSKRRWEFIGDENVKRNFWGMEYYDGGLYIAFAGGIMVHDGMKLLEVTVPDGVGRDFHRLHAADGLLLSTGVDQVIYFENKKWSILQCPLNN